MPIDYNRVSAQKDFVVLAADTTVGEAYWRIPLSLRDRAYTYLVVPRADGAYVVVRWIELEEIARLSGYNITGEHIAALVRLTARPGYIPSGEPVSAKLAGLTLDALLRRFAPAAAVDEQTTSTQAAQEARDAHPGRRLVVTSSGVVVCLLTVETLGGELGPSPIDALMKPHDQEATTCPAVLGAKSPAVLGGVGEPEVDEPPTDTRAINGWIEGGVRGGLPDSVSTWRRIGRNTALLAGQTYELKFAVDVEQADVLLFIGGVGRLAAQAAKQSFDIFEILVEIVVDPNEFVLYGRDNDVLFVPQAARPSKNRVSFSIEPKQGIARGTITATFYAFNEIFQQASFTVKVTQNPAEATIDAVAGATTVEVRGLTLATAIANPPMRPPDERISLVIIRQTTGYQFILQGAVVKRASVKIEPEGLNDLLANARGDFYAIVTKQVDGGWPYLDQNTQIDEAVHQHTLRELATLGRRLFDDIFFHSENGSDAHEMAELLRDYSRTRTRLNIKVVADRFILPWALIYPFDDTENPVEDEFWGFKHIVQYMPEFAATGLSAFEPTITVSGPLPMSFVYDASIDAQFNATVIRDQRGAFTATAYVSANEIATKRDLLGLLKNVGAPPLLYFYTHAESMQTGERRPNEIAGVASSYVTVAEGKVTLKTMRDEVRPGRLRFKNAPLVFLNACQGAELTATQYDGLLPYFLALGARGAIGTEVNTPVYFAAEFAQKFIPSFARGEEALGDLLLRLRREYLKDKRNVMGLVYALYSSGDIRVVRLGV